MGCFFLGSWTGTSSNQALLVALEMSMDRSKRLVRSQALGARRGKGIEMKDVEHRKLN